MSICREEFFFAFVKSLLSLHFDPRFEPSMLSLEKLVGILGNWNPKHQRHDGNTKESVP